MRLGNTRTLSAVVGVSCLLALLLPSVATAGDGAPPGFPGLEKSLANGDAPGRIYAGTHLSGSNTESCTILYTPTPDPGEKSKRAGKGGDGATTGGPNSTRVSASEKGSVLIYPKVEVRWDANGQLVQDTLITLNNDYYQDVHIVMYFVVEGCLASYRDTSLTANEAAYWSAYTGSPKQVGPFHQDVEPYADPEEPFGVGDTTVRGFIVLFATNEYNEQIRWNHLYGAATIVNYRWSSAWEYNAYAFKALDSHVQGEVVGTPGVINLDGSDYDSCFGTLLMDFYASNDLDHAVFPSAFGLGIAVDTDLTLLIPELDLRQGGQPVTTKAQFWIWDENGWSRRAHYCLTCWDEWLLSNVGGPFLISNLQTDKGRARIEGIANVECPDSTARPLLGVAVTWLTFDN